MDLSKLPKFSQTSQPPNPPEQTPLPSGQFCDQCGAPIGAGSRFCPGCGRALGVSRAIPLDEVSPAEIWIAAFLGVIFMLMGGTFARWAIARLTGQPFDTNVNWTAGDKAGQPVEYFELQGFVAWSDMGVFLFGLAMLFEAVALLMISRDMLRTPALGLALLVAVSAIVANILVSLKLFQVGILPILSLMAIAFGGLLLFRLWALHKLMWAQKIAPGAGKTPRAQGG